MQADIQVASRLISPNTIFSSTFADSLRKQRSQLAEEMAAKSTIKLMFPPSMFMVLLCPAALTISRNLGSLSGR